MDAFLSLLNAKVILELVQVTRIPMVIALVDGLGNSDRNTKEKISKSLLTESSDLRKLRVGNGVPFLLKCGRAELLVFMSLSKKKAIRMCPAITRLQMVSVLAIGLMRSELTTEAQGIPNSRPTKLGSLRVLKAGHGIQLMRVTGKNATTAFLRLFNVKGMRYLRKNTRVQMVSSLACGLTGRELNTKKKK